MRFSALILSLSKDAASAVQILVEGAGVIGEAGAFERGDDEARIGAVQRVLGLADDAPCPAPAVNCAILEVAEYPCGLARHQT
jgi:hypothetical protein